DIPIVRNNSVIGGTFGFYAEVTNALVKDNLFDRTTIPDWLGGFGEPYDGGYNAYVTNCDRLQPTYASDLILSNSPLYEAGPLGNYYEPSNSPLINVGTTNANLLSLYHFTTQTNQVKETNSIVDIGFHYVATDGNGVPIDTNGDGIPDYWEDANGNGSIESGEIGWNIPGDPGLSIQILQ